MSLIRFIDEDMIRAACVDEAEVASAIAISAKFCAKTFTLEACIEHPREVSTFCAGTIVFARKKKIQGRKDGERAFTIKNDLHNELVSACHSEQHPLPILGHLRAPKKCNYKIYEYIDDMEKDTDDEESFNAFSGSIVTSDSNNYNERREEFLVFGDKKKGEPVRRAPLFNMEQHQEDTIVVFSYVEQMIIRELDGNVRASSLMQFYHLKRAEAEAVANNIKKKFIAITEVC